MSKNEAVALRILEDFRSGLISRRQAAEFLGCSERAVSRRTNKLRQKGIEGIKHGNYQKPARNRLDQSQRDEMLRLAREQYFDFNISHCLEMLTARHGLTVSYTTFHRWNGKDEWCLIAMIDDATSEIPAARFFEGETTLACMKVLRAVIESKGVPQMIYTDQAGWASGGEKRRGSCQFVRVCEELGIRVINTSSAESKGRIELAWRTTQDRLIPDMRLAGVTSMLDANRYLDQVYLPKYWQDRNTVKPRDEQSRYRPLLPHEKLDEIFCIKHTRQIYSDHAVHFDNQLYRIKDRSMGSLRKK